MKSLEGLKGGCHEKRGEHRPSQAVKAQSSSEGREQKKTIQSSLGEPDCCRTLQGPSLVSVMAYESIMLALKNHLVLREWIEKTRQEMADCSAQSGLHDSGCCDLHLGVGVEPVGYFTAY